MSSGGGIGEAGPIGGISNSGTAILKFVTITGNDGIGINNSRFNGTGTVKLSNSILAANKSVQIEVCDDFGENCATFTVSDCLGTLKSKGSNLLGNLGEGANCVFEDTTGDLVGTTSNPIDPRLRPLADNGGATETHALKSGSPAIDSGNNAVCPDTDQRGFGRPVDGDGNGSRICDIGAVERGALPPRGP